MAWWRRSIHEAQRRVTGLNLKGGQTVPPVDTANLANTLENMCQRIVAATPDARYSSVVTDARRPARFAAKGGFQIQLLPPAPPRSPSSEGSILRPLARKWLGQT